ncbi:MAG: hypothetical protein NVSMB56_09740 [Pyrinomonadaceae bacterium]
MNWLFDNPLANMQGPAFLFFYGCIIGLTLVACFLLRRSFDQSAKLPPPPIPTAPDPFEIAFLRGGANEVARAVVFALTQRGYLFVTDAKKYSTIARTQTKLDLHALHPIELKTYNWFNTPRQPAELFRSNGLKDALAPFCKTYEENLQRNNFLSDATMKGRGSASVLICSTLIFTLGGYKFFAALAHGRTNVIFLFIFGIIGLILIYNVGKIPRLTRRGRAYLEKLQTAFEGLKKQVKTKHAKEMTIKDNFAVVDPMLLAVATFGVATLAGTAYNSYHEAFRLSAQTGGSSCGSSCGSPSGSSDSGGSSCSSSDGGGSCGGGCAGCGGS